MDLMKEYEKPQNYVPSLRRGLVRGFNDYMNMYHIHFNDYDGAVANYVDTLNVTTKTKVKYRNMLRTLMNNIVINNYGK